MELIKLSFAISIIAFTYSVILTEPHQILNGVYEWLEKRLPEWLFFPIIGCEKCVSGQMGLWYYLLFYDGKYSIFEHLFVILFPIFIVTFIKPLYSWMQRF